MPKTSPSHTNSAARPTAAIVGASTDRGKFGNKSVRAHMRAGYEVYPVHPNAAQIEGLVVYASVRDVPAERLDRVSLYLSPERGLDLLDDIAAKGCDELWLNPGSESPELLARARSLDLNVIAGCSIVALGISPSELSDH